MSILITGTEMPKGGNETIVRIQPDGTILDQYGHHLAITAIPVKPHGRLIDADELRNDWLENGENSYVYDTNSFLWSLDDAPTVIPAEEGET